MQSHENVLLTYRDFSANPRSEELLVTFLRNGDILIIDTGSF